MMKLAQGSIIHLALVAITALYAFETNAAAPSADRAGSTARAHSSKQNRKMATTDAQDCRLCAELLAIAEETRKETKKHKFDIDSLQLRASSVIQKMPDSTGRLNGLQISAVVAAFAASVPHDPAAAIIENNLEILRANREAFKLEIAKLPKSQANDLNEAIAIALNLDSEGTDPSN